MKIGRTRTTSMKRIGAAAIAAVAIALIPSAGAAIAGSGGVGTTSGSTDGQQAGSGSGATAGKYVRIWKRLPAGERRWARRTSECESGGDPDAIGGGGTYRGAFQFMRSTWKTAPKSPGGDPIKHPYRTQAVVAVALKRRAGTSPWPVCG